MFYRPEDGHGLKHSPFKAIVAPRPIGWISSISADGVANLAPYSFFQAMQDMPPVIGFASARKDSEGSRKDSLLNIQETGFFGVNVVSFALKDAMNISSAPVGFDVDEFETAGLTKTMGTVVATPLVAEAPVSLECKLRDIIPLEATHWVMGDVVGVHIKDEFVKDGILDVTAYRPIARLGYKDYSSTDDVFALDRPKA